MQNFPASICFKIWEAWWLEDCPEESETGSLLIVYMHGDLDQVLSPSLAFPCYANTIIFVDLNNKRGQIGMTDKVLIASNALWTGWCFGIRNILKRVRQISKVKYIRFSRSSFDKSFQGQHKAIVWSTVLRIVCATISGSPNICQGKGKPPDSQYFPNLWSYH